MSLGLTNRRYFTINLMHVEQSITSCVKQLACIKTDSILNSDIQGKNSKIYYDSIRNMMLYNISEWVG